MAYLAVAIGLLSPVASANLVDSPFGDLEVHLAAVVEAQNALLEGQFPLRVAPKLHDGARYPLFQFYGNFPYTAPALIALAGVGPYTAWKLFVIGMLTSGAFALFRCAHHATRNRAAAFLAGAVFMTSPYMLADLQQRFAYPELISFNVAPIALYFSDRAFARRRIRYVFASGIAWTFLALSHNVTFLYGALFIAASFVLRLAPTVRYVTRLAYVGAGFAWGLLLDAWHIVPQSSVVQYLAVTRSIVISPSDFTWLTPLATLFSPTNSPVPDIRLSTPGLGLQVGWPVLISVGVVIDALVRGVGSRRLRCGILPPLLLFGASFVLVWSPVDFWPRLPQIFHYVQFPYRLLIFSALWGAVLAAYALAVSFRRLTVGRAALGVIVLVLAAAPHLLAHRPLAPDALERVIRDADMSRSQAPELYQLAPDSISQIGGSAEALRPSATFIDREQSSLSTTKGYPIRFRLVAEENTVVVLPVFFYPGLLEVRDRGVGVEYLHLSRWLALHLAPGEHDVEVRFRGIAWANAVSSVAWVVTVFYFAAVLLWSALRVGSSPSRATS